VSRYQKSKTNPDFTEARDSEWQWHQLGRVQVYTSLQTDNHTSTPPLCFFTGRMPFLPPNRQRQSTEGNTSQQKIVRKKLITKTMYADKNEQGQRSMEKHTDNWCLTQCRGILHIIIKTHVFLNKYVFDFCITGDQTSRHNYYLVILNKQSWFKAQSTTKKPQYQHSIHGPNCLTTEFNQSVTQFLRTKLLTTFN